MRYGSCTSEIENMLFRETRVVHAHTRSIRVRVVGINLCTRGIDGWYIIIL